MVEETSVNKINKVYNKKMNKSFNEYRIYVDTLDDHSIGHLGTLNVNHKAWEQFKIHKYGSLTYEIAYLVYYLLKERVKYSNEIMYVFIHN